VVGWSKTSSSTFSPPSSQTPSFDPASNLPSQPTMSPPSTPSPSPFLNLISNSSVIKQGAEAVRPPSSHSSPPSLPLSFLSELTFSSPFNLSQPESLQIPTFPHSSSSLDQTSIPQTLPTPSPGRSTDSSSGDLRSEMSRSSSERRSHSSWAERS